MIATSTAEINDELMASIAQEKEKHENEIETLKDKENDLQQRLAEEELKISEAKQQFTKYKEEIHKIVTATGFPEV
ncbi:hypothetical protein AGOR_G00113120 [Albula goreensis]|uniref:Uncharacterized protein n=1 Tax=Albula goreensis TaxID=1534307 RepID=A0A8T3DD50_9TELE|nr:hypothetical protein AGOR_G00113120 [Albula goreensis]